MWHCLHRILSLIVPFLPVRLRIRFWNYLFSRGRRIWQPSDMAQRVEGHMYIKLSVLTRPSEGFVIDYVRKNTTIPVPIVIDNVTVDGITALVLGELPGEDVRVVRAELGLSPEQAKKLSHQISALLGQLRSLPPPSESVCGWNNTPVRCERLAMGSEPLGPWPSVNCFNTAMVDRARIRAPPEVSDVVWRTINEVHARSHRVCLTHNDFAPQNVLVDKDYNITGIIDWEASAWLPEYWEYTKALFLPWNRKGWWYEVMKVVFPQYELENLAEYYIWNYREVYV
ncbi:kinase-like protein [Mucidula mucida]|nr:kinase-like protein [Mucidula mucida]